MGVWDAGPTAGDAAGDAGLAAARGEEVRHLQDGLRAAGNIGWESQAAGAFRDELEMCARYYSAGADALEEAAEALRGLAVTLGDSGGE